MFGLDGIKVAVVSAAVVASLGAGYAVYHGIQAAEAAKIELQQAKLVAAAQHEQDERSMAALETKAALAATLEAQLSNLKETIHAVPVTRVCLSSPAGRAFSVWLHNSSGLSGAAGKAAGKPLAVPGAASGPR